MKRQINNQTVNLSTFTDSQLNILAENILSLIQDVSDSQTVEEIRQDAESAYPALKSRKTVKRVAFLLGELETLYTDTHHQITQETLEWGGGLSGNIFSTTRQLPTISLPMESLPVKR